MTVLRILRVIFFFLLLFPILLFAQGQVFWQANGVCVCNGTFSGGDYTVSIVSDSCGGAIVIWSDTRGYQSSIYAQRIDKDGNCLWVPNGVLLRNDTWYPECLFATSDGKGGAIAVWRDHFAGPYARQITVQRVDSSGTVCWGPNGFLITGADRDVDYFPMIETDGRGGVIVGWIMRNFENEYADSVFVQRIDSLGQIKWTPGGVSVGADSCYCYDVPPSLSTDRYNGVIITWSDERGGGDFGVYAQRVDSSGNTLWFQGGTPVCTILGYYSKSNVKTSRIGTYLVSWSDNRQGDWNVYAQLIDLNGQYLWQTNGVQVCADTGGQGWPEAILTEDNEYFILSWFDTRNSQYDIYGQKLNFSGRCHWDSLGVFVGRSHFNENQRFSMISDNRNGAILTWQYWGANGWGIYSQRIDSNGRLCWGDSGLAVCTDTTSQQWIPVITTDEVNGTIIAWGDIRQGGSIYAQRVGDAVGLERADDRTVSDCKFQITPNPAGTFLDIRLPQNANNQAIKIFNVSGKMVKNTEVVTSAKEHKQEMKISLKGISPGVYFLRVGKEPKKFVVAK